MQSTKKFISYTTYIFTQDFHEKKSAGTTAVTFEGFFSYNHIFGNGHNFLTTKNKRTHIISKISL